MSDAQTCGNKDDGGEAGKAGGSAAIIDVLLVIDTVTLLDDHPEAADRPVSVDEPACYRLSPNNGALSGTSGDDWSLDVHPGERLRLRWTPLAMRGEHAVLLQLALTDEATLSHSGMHVEENAVRYAPQAGKPEEAVAREAPDAFWQADVVAGGTAELSVEATVMDRDAAVLGCFAWTLRIVVP